MTNYDATEQAYKNGYEKGYAEAKAKYYKQQWLFSDIDTLIDMQPEEEQAPFEEIKKICRKRKRHKFFGWFKDGKFSFWILLVNSITLAINTAMLIIMLRR